jgi:type IV pilus assembly protein PilE
MSPIPRLRAQGFSLIELMAVVAIIGILSAIAIPAYRDYVIRARLTEAFSGLASVQTAAEDYWNNKHTYVDLEKESPRRLPPDSANFTFTLSASSASAYTVTAAGAGTVTGFSYTIDQNGVRATTAAPTGWGTSASCWIDRKGGVCVQ